MMSSALKLYDHVDIILWEATMSQIFYLGPTFHFMPKNGKLFTIFCIFFFLDCIK